MTVPDRPTFVKQLDGSRYAGLNCTCASGAMALDRWTLGQKRATGSYIRFLTGDTVGGTTLAQVRDAINRTWGHELDVEYNLAWDTFSDRIERGQGAILQGWAAVTRGTKWQGSETFGGNHAWFVNNRIGDSFVVFDPLADGRRSGIAHSPLLIPASVVREYAGKLNIATSGYRALGLGKVYAAFTRDTEPHVHLHYGGRRTDPFPDHTTATGGGYMRTAPKVGSAYRVRPLVKGETFTAYQYAYGDSFNGSRKWYGNHNGNRWVHSSRLTGKGGTR